MTGSLLVRGGEVLFEDGRLERADVLVLDGAVAEVGDEVAPPRDVEVLEAAGMIVAPGLVNAHMHSGENLNPGLYENLPLDLWFVHSHEVTRSAPPDAEEIYARTLLGAALMLRSGTTAAVDFLYEAPAITLETLEPVVRAYRDAGLRATILLGVADRPFASSLPLADAESLAQREAPPPTLAAIMELARAAVDRWHEPGGLIGIGLGPSAPQRCSPELLDATMELARERGLVWQTHVLETRTQALTCRDWHGQTFVELLHARGLLGPEATLVHTVWLSDEDVSLMRRTDTAAVHCLMSNLRLGDGVARLADLLRAGVRVALGTDGRGCDESLDVLELTKMTALVHKARGGDFRRWPTAADALRLATTEASACAGHGERLGRIAPGALGDLMLLPRDAPAFTPLHDPVRQLVFAASARDIRAVIVGGRVVVRDGQLPGIDLDAALARARAASDASDRGEPDREADALASSVTELHARMEAAPLELDRYVP